MGSLSILQVTFLVVVSQLPTSTISQKDKDWNNIRNDKLRYDTKDFSHEYDTEDFSQEYGTEDFSHEYDTEDFSHEYGKEDFSHKYGIEDFSHKYGTEDFSREYSTDDLSHKVVKLHIFTQPQPSPTVNGCPTVDGLFQENNGNCFHFSESETNWPDARDYCQQLGRNFSRFGDLAELGNPNNLGSDYWLMETIARKGGWTWLGGYSPKENNNWIWAYTGRSLGLDFPSWGPNEPTGDGSCITAYANGEYGRFYMNNVACGAVDNYYVCQLF